MGLFDKILGKEEETEIEQTENESEDMRQVFKDLTNTLNLRLPMRYISIITTFERSTSDNSTEISDIMVFLLLCEKLNKDKIVFINADEESSTLVLSFYNDQGEEYCFAIEDVESFDFEQLIKYIKG